MFSYFLNWKHFAKVKFEDIKTNTSQLHTQSKEEFRPKFAGIFVLNVKETILKNLNVSSIVYFCFVKDSVNLGNFLYTLYIYKHTEIFS